MKHLLEHIEIPVNGVRLHVVLAGPAEGEPVVLLHGFPEYWRGWEKQIEPLAQAGYRLILPDQRGYNLSEVPSRVEAYRLQELCADVTGLLDHFGYERASLVGHDWGAGVAWYTALTNPGRVRGLAVLNMPHPAVVLKFMQSSPRQMLKSWYIGFIQIPGVADWLLSRNDFHAAILQLKVSGRAGTFSPAELAGYREAWSNSGGLTGMLNWYRAMVRYRPPLPTDWQMQMPVLMLWGKQDVALQFEMAPASLAYCPQGRLQVFEQATHWVQHDEAEAVSQELLNFLQEDNLQENH